MFGETKKITKVGHRYPIQRNSAPSLSSPTKQSKYTSGWTPLSTKMTVAPQQHALPQQSLPPTPPPSLSHKQPPPITPTLSPPISSLARSCDDVKRPLKRLKRTTLFNSSSLAEMDDSEESELYAAAIPADTAESVRKDIAPFLLKHIPGQYAPQGPGIQTHQDIEQKGNTKFCYRHRPDIKCRRQADEPNMEQLQKVCMPSFLWCLVHACIVADSRFQGDGNTPNCRSASNI